MRAIVLAAGLGRRMGGPKALVDWRGVPLAVAHATALLHAGADEVLVVVRDAVARRLVVPARTCLVVSTEPDELGPAGSLRAAVTQAGLAPDATEVITPVDALPVRRETLQAMARAHGGPPRADGRPRATRPVHDGHGGHPVLVDGAVLAPFHADHPPTLREVLRMLGDRVQDVDVDDAGVTADLDTPGDLARWR